MMLSMCVFGLVLLFFFSSFFFNLNWNLIFDSKKLNNLNATTQNIILKRAHKIVEGCKSVSSRTQNGEQIGIDWVRLGWNDVESNWQWQKRYFANFLLPLSLTWIRKLFSSHKENGTFNSCTGWTHKNRLSCYLKPIKSKKSGPFEMSPPMDIGKWLWTDWCLTNTQLWLWIIPVCLLNKWHTPISWEWLKRWLHVFWLEINASPHWVCDDFNDYCIRINFACGL